jgi:hypothetical protein
MWRVKEGLAIRPLPGGDAVVAGKDGMNAVIVNASAHAVLELFVEARDEAEIADLFCETFPDRDPAHLRRDVAALVQELAGIGILQPCGTASSTA